MSGFVVDLHVHTRYGSSCSRLDPQRLVVVARELGLNGICITEHDYLWDTDRVRDLADNSGIVIFRGVELSTDQGHLLVFGLKDYPEDLYCAEKLRDAADKMGAVVVVAHPYRHTPGRVSWKKVARRPAFRLAHEVEIYNGISSEADNELAFQLGTRLGFCGVGGSDAHTASQVGLGVTIFDNPIGGDGELVEALKARSFQAGRRIEEGFLPVASYRINSKAGLRAKHLEFD